MKQTWWIGMAALVAVTATPARSTQTSGRVLTSQCMQRSNDLLAALKTQRFADATAHFDARVSSALSPAMLAKVWTAVLPGKAGAFKASGVATAGAAQGHAVIETPLHFEKAELQLRVSCDDDGKIGGLFFVPQRTSDGTAAPVTHADGVREQAMPVRSPLGPLPGLLTLPTGHGPFPAVVLVPGSGPQDRDETIGPNKPLRDIALGLARDGIASLRYDKRTLTYASQVAGTQLTINDAVTDDADSALQSLRSSADVDTHHLFVLGHSIGALMAPRIARRDGKLAGVILLAAPVSLSMDVVVHQLRYLQSVDHRNAAGIDPMIKTAEAARDTLAKADPAHPPKGEFFHAPASFWLSLRDYDAIAVAKTLKTPMLVLQGLGDFQVPPETAFARWEKAFGNSPRVTLHAYPDLSHLFMPAGDPPSQADYAKPGRIDPKVIGDISTWIKAQPAALR